MKQHIVVKIPVNQNGIERLKTILVPCYCRSLDDYFEGLYLKQTNSASVNANIYEPTDQLKQPYEQWKYDHRNRLNKLRSGAGSPIYQHTETPYTQDPYHEKSDHINIGQFIKPCTICGHINGQ